MCRDRTLTEGLGVAVSRSASSGSMRSSAQARLVSQVALAPGRTFTLNQARANAQAYEAGARARLRAVSLGLTGLGERG